MVESPGLLLLAKVSLYQIDEHAPNALRPGKRTELRVQIIWGARRQTAGEHRHRG